MPGSHARRRVLATALTAVAHVAVLLGAAAVGVLIAARFGASAETDGFFAANAVYGIALFVAQSFRTTAVAPVLEGATPSLTRFDAHVGGGLLLFGLCGFVFLAFGSVAAPLVTGDLPDDARATAQLALAILWPAAGLQLFSGLGAAMLAAFDDYTLPALAYGGGALATVLGYLVLVPSAGIAAVPLGLGIGATVAAATIAVGLLRRGWHPAGVLRSRGWGRIAGRLLLGSVALVAAQVALAATVSFAARTGEGGATLYSYAMMAVTVLTAALASPVTVVYAPVVARMAGKAPDALADLSVRTFRLGAIALVPAAAALYLAGQEPASWLLREFTERDITRLFEVVLILSPSVVAAQLVMVPLLGVLTEQRYTALAAWSGIVVAVHVAGCAACIALGGGLQALAGLSVATSFGLAGVIVALAFRRRAIAVLADVARAVLTLTLPGALLMSAAAWLVDWDGGLLRGVAATLGGGTAFAAYLALAHREELTAVAALLRREAK